MKSSLTCVALVVVLAACAAAFAGPGDPRLVNGVLEWPRAVTNEPFIVVRGDDGALYYVTIAAARREATLGAGGRVAVLGLEGRTAHEISALGIGAGDSVESALANLQGAKSAPTAAAPASPNGGVAITAPTAKSPSAPPSQAGVMSARPQAPPTSSSSTPTTAAPTAPVTVPAPSTAPAPNGSATTPNATASAPAVSAPAPAVSAPAPAVTAPTPAGSAAAPTAAAPAPAPAPAVTAPAPAVTAPAPAVTPTTPGVGPYPAVISAPTAAPAVAATAPPPKPAVTEVAPASAPVSPVVRDERRWTEITGVVESISGRTLVLRAPEGRVAVDMSSLSSNLERIVTPGATVRVYGLPVELRFKAMGFFDPGGRP